MTPIAILSYNREKYSETFLRAPVKSLPYEVHYLYEGELPQYYGNDEKFINDSGFGKVIIAIKEWLGSSRQKQHELLVEEYLLKHKIKAVLANYSITAIPVMGICKKHNIPLVVHFHGWTAYRSTVIQTYKSEYQRMFEIASAIIGVSTDMIEQLKRLGAEGKKLHLITYGFNSEIFKYSNHSDNKNIFFTAGRFCDTKNPHFTILAFHKVLEKIPDAKLLMAGGDENLLNACVSLVKALKIEDKVEFRGELSPDQMYNCMKEAVAYVQHSATTALGEKEGTPVTILEACACGLPVIATRHAGIKDVIIEEETGLLGDELDVNAMAQNMIKVASNRDFAKRLGENASKRVNENFTMEKYIQKLNSVIEQVILGNKNYNR